MSDGGCVPPARFDVHGIELLYHLPHTADRIQESMRRTGRLYEHDLLHDVLTRPLGPGVVIDVGANIGVHTVFFAKVLRRKVVALEPFETTFDVLKANVSLNQIGDLVTALPKAAGRRAATGRLIPPPPANLGQARIDSSREGPVEIIRLDELPLLEPVALMKIDVEDMELEVVEGARRLLDEYRPLLYVEARTQAAYAQIRSCLPSGYEMACRFNHTPTYVFVACWTTEDRVSALLDRTECLSRLEDLATAQRDLGAQLAVAKGELDRRITNGTTALLGHGSARERRLNEVVGLIKELRAEMPTVALLRHFRAAMEAHLKQLGGNTASAALLHETRQRLEHYIDHRVTRRGYSSRFYLGRPSAGRPPRPIACGGHAREVSVLAFPARAGRMWLEIVVPVRNSAQRRFIPAAEQARQDTNVVAAVMPSRATTRTSIPDTLKNPSVRHRCSHGSVREPLAHKVSVVMTTYNSAQFVGEAVQSLLNQTHSNLEVIVVDDASTDETFEILGKLTLCDSRVRPIKSFRNRGTYWCKNLGMTKASGCIVTFQDSDDASHPRRIELQVLELLKHGDTVMCTCNYVRTDQDRNILLNRGRRERKAIMAPLFYKDAVIAGAGYFDCVRTSADDEFIRRIGLVFGDARTAHVNAPLYFAKRREGSLTTSAGTQAEIHAAAPDCNLSFLSVARREYVRQYRAWHQRIRKESESPVMPFPLVRRKFTAPLRLLPTPGKADEFITASMASIPQRQNLLKQTVASILPQVDVLNVYLNGYPGTPAFLVHPNIRVVHSAEYGDLRDNGKFFFLDSLTWGYHFTIDDDIVYPPDYVQKHILKIEQYDRQAIVGCHGVILAHPLVRYMEGREVIHFQRRAANDGFVNILGTGTTAYHVSTLELTFDDFRLPGMADLWLAIAAKRQRVAMIAVERPDRWLTPLVEADANSLYGAARKDDRAQTEIAKKERPWRLEELCPSYRLITDYLGRFTDDELASQAVDVRAFPTRMPERGRGTTQERRLVHG